MPIRYPHEMQHPFAGKLVPLLMKDSKIGDQRPAAMFRVADWADRLGDQDWRTRRNMTVLIYRARAKSLDLPDDDHVVAGTLLGIPFLIHTREIDWSRL